MHSMKTAVEIDESNQQFQTIAQLVENTEKTLFITGKAGTGKTTLLKFLLSSTVKETLILAPTGVAAVNAGGQTIHSFFKIKPSVYEPNDQRLRIKPKHRDTNKSTIHDYLRLPKSKIEVINNLQVLVIDEISMVRCDTLDVVDKILRVYRNEFNKPFGGVQVILLGDVFQLPPVIKPDEEIILQKFYKSPFYFFNSKVFEEANPIHIELSKTYRQHEKEFIDILSAIRNGKISNDQLNKLNAQFNPNPSIQQSKPSIYLVAINKKAEKINNQKLRELNTPLHTFNAEIEGDFPKEYYPASQTLFLKVGAQIIFTRNDEGKRFYNGKMGTIVKIEEEALEIKPENNNGVITVERELWNHIKYSWDEIQKRIKEEVIGTFYQFPVKLSWAITIHKSQGLTFNNIIADLSDANGFGQIYVALSRCRTLDGIVLSSKLDSQTIKTNAAVIEFAQIQATEEVIQHEINLGIEQSAEKLKIQAQQIAEKDFQIYYSELLEDHKNRSNTISQTSNK